MTNLTEKWEKGELPHGWYYIKIADIVFIDFFEGKVWKNKKDKYINEVLGKVPSYGQLREKEIMYDTTSRCNEKLLWENEELKKIIQKTKANGNYPDRISRLKSRVVALSEENTKLKELLHENRQKMFEAEKNYGFDDSIIEILTPQIDKIDEVLGDKTDENK